MLTGFSYSLPHLPLGCFLAGVWDYFANQDISSGWVNITISLFTCLMSPWSNVCGCEHSVECDIPLWYRFSFKYSLCFHFIFLSCLISGLPSSSIFSLNSIAYRRVICVYQYQVADDLSGRSTSFKHCYIFYCLFWSTQYSQGCVYCTNITSLQTQSIRLQMAHPTSRPASCQLFFTLWTPGMENANNWLPLYICTHLLMLHLEFGLIGIL